MCIIKEKSLSDKKKKMMNVLYDFSIFEENNYKTEFN